LLLGLLAGHELLLNLADLVLDRLLLPLPSHTFIQTLQ
jgi:hypothetical protein